jgi:hypothetical protein
VQNQRFVAGKTATEKRIEFRDPARLEFDGSTVLKSFKSSSDETCFEFPCSKVMAVIVCSLALTD